MVDESSSSSAQPSLAVAYLEFSLARDVALGTVELSLARDVALWNDGECGCMVVGKADGGLRTRISVGVGAAGSLRIGGCCLGGSKWFLVYVECAVTGVATADDMAGSWL